MSERFSTLQLEFQMFLSTIHQANAPEEHYTREDADLLIAMTPATLRFAPALTIEPKGYI
ncbi:MAG: hypothetical protein EOO71_01365 [Myxococcaceae bacterium]|nr:MAG: hypothetical protein EOO71_01365 [Myxococcaceae bacterium]